MSGQLSCSVWGGSISEELREKLCNGHLVKKKNNNTKIFLSSALYLLLPHLISIPLLPVLLAG